jgi:hypothetical protein
VFDPEDCMFAYDPRCKHETPDREKTFGASFKGSFFTRVGVKSCFPGLRCGISMQSLAPMMKSRPCSRENAPGLSDASFTR